MPEVVSISDAKAQLSKLVKRAMAGETIYIGAYGTAQVVLGPAPVREPIPIGIWADRKVPDFDYFAPDLIGSDPEIVADFEASIEGSVMPDDDS